MCTWWILIFRSQNGSSWPQLHSSWTILAHIPSVFQSTSPSSWPRMRIKDCHSTIFHPINGQVQSPFLAIWHLMDVLGDWIRTLAQCSQRFSWDTLLVDVQKSLFERIIPPICRSSENMDCLCLTQEFMVESRLGRFQVSMTRSLYRSEMYKIRYTVKLQSSHVNYLVLHHPVNVSSRNMCTTHSWQIPVVAITVLHLLR